MTNILVSNLSFQTTQEQLQDAFGSFGAIERINIVVNPASGQPRGFAYVEMTDREEAENAIANMNGSELNGRSMNVNEAKPKTRHGVLS